MKNHSLISFLSGVTLGAVIALLVAPDSGKNTRQKIGCKLRHGEHKMKEAIEEELNMQPREEY